MKILEILSGEKYISGNEIGRLLGVSRAAVHKRIKRLRAEGFVVQASACGYKLVSPAFAFDAKTLSNSLPGQGSLFKKIIYLEKTSSTQIKLKELAGKGEPEGTLIVAGKQDAAYGRRKRVWRSDAGGLWFSMLLKPEIHPGHSPKLSLLLGLALNRVLNAEYGIRTEIKWTNDIVYGSKKVAGIIIEMSAEQDMINWVVAGVGINSNNELPRELGGAEALNKILNKNIDRAELLSLLLKEFERIYSDFKAGDFSGFVCEYNENMAFMDENVIIDDGFDIIKGVNKGINEDGKLIVETERGFKEVISGTLRRSG